MISVTILDKRYRKLVKPVRNSAARLLKIANKRNFALDIYLVPKRLMWKNVLAYPAPKSVPRPDLGGEKPLGEIYLNPDYIRKHGGDLTLMLVHGFAHLLGYDHKRKNDRIRMEKKEAWLFSQL